VARGRKPFPGSVRIARVASRWYSVVVDCRDPRAQAQFWSAVLDLPIFHEADDELCVGAEGREPELTFVPVPESKTGKNRLHIDLAPDDQEEEVERLLGLGASRVDVGQGDQPWVVLADPEGNEFCVLTPR
jgi:catechol-2,3-dioxygenase